MSYKSINHILNYTKYPTLENDMKLNAEISRRSRLTLPDEKIDLKKVVVDESELSYHVENAEELPLLNRYNQTIEKEALYFDIDNTNSRVRLDHSIVLSYDLSNKLDWRTCKNDQKLLAYAGSNIKTDCRLIDCSSGTQMVPHEVFSGLLGTDNDQLYSKSLQFLSRYMNVNSRTTLASITRISIKSLLDRPVKAQSYLIRLWILYYAFCDVEAKGGNVSNKHIKRNIIMNRTLHRIVDMSQWEKLIVQALQSEFNTINLSSLGTEVRDLQTKQTMLSIAEALTTDEFPFELRVGRNKVNLDLTKYWGEIPHSNIIYFESNDIGLNRWNTFDSTDIINFIIYYCTHNNLWDQCEEASNYVHGPWMTLRNGGNHEMIHHKLSGPGGREEKRKKSVVRYNFPQTETSACVMSILVDMNVDRFELERGFVPNSHKKWLWNSACNSLKYNYAFKQTMKQLYEFDMTNDSEERRLFMNSYTLRNTTTLGRKTMDQEVIEKVHLELFNHRLGTLHMNSIASKQRKIKDILELCKSNLDTINVGMFLTKIPSRSNISGLQTAIKILRGNIEIGKIYWCTNLDISEPSTVEHIYAMKQFLPNLKVFKGWVSNIENIMAVHQVLELTDYVNDNLLNRNSPSDSAIIKDCLAVYETIRNKHTVIYGVCFTDTAELVNFNRFRERLGVSSISMYFGLTTERNDATTFAPSDRGYGIEEFYEDDGSESGDFNVNVVPPPDDEDVEFLFSHESSDSFKPDEESSEEQPEVELDMNKLFDIREYEEILEPTNNLDDANIDDEFDTEVAAFPYFAQQFDSAYSSMHANLEEERASRKLLFGLQGFVNQVREYDERTSSSYYYSLEMDVVKRAVISALIQRDLISYSNISLINLTEIPATKHVFQNVKPYDFLVATPVELRKKATNMMAFAQKVMKRRNGDNDMLNDIMDRQQPWSTINESIQSVPYVTRDEILAYSKSLYSDSVMKLLTDEKLEMIINNSKGNFFAELEDFIKGEIQNRDLELLDNLGMSNWKDTTYSPIYGRLLTQRDKVSSLNKVNSLRGFPIKNVGEVYDKEYGVYLPFYHGLEYLSMLKVSAKVYIDTTTGELVASRGSPGVNFNIRSTFYDIALKQAKIIIGMNTDETLGQAECDLLGIDSDGILPDLEVIKGKALVRNNEDTVGFKYTMLNPSYRDTVKEFSGDFKMARKYFMEYGVYDKTLIEDFIEKQQESTPRSIPSRTKSKKKGNKTGSRKSGGKRTKKEVKQDIMDVTSTTLTKSNTIGTED